MRSLSTQIDLPFTAHEWRFFAAIAVVSLALDIAVMWVEHWLIVLASGSDRYAAYAEGFAIATLFAQLVIVAIWAALFVGSNLLRVLVATLAVVLVYYALYWIAAAIAPSLFTYREWARVTGLP